MSLAVRISVSIEHPLKQSKPVGTVRPQVFLRDVFVIQQAQLPQSGLTGLFLFTVAVNRFAQNGQNGMVFLPVVADGEIFIPQFFPDILCDLCCILIEQSNLRTRTGSIAEPHAESIRRNRQFARGLNLERFLHGNPESAFMVTAFPNFVSGSQPFRIPYIWIPASINIFHLPEVTGIADNGFSIAERDPVAIMVGENLRFPDYPALMSLLIKKPVSNLNISHRGPPGLRGKRGVQGKRLTRTTRHSQRKESASQNRRFNLLNHLQMIRRPCKSIGLREIALTEKLEIAFARGFPVGIHDLRERADVASGERLFRLTVAFGVASILIAARAGRLLRCVFPVEHPGNVFQEVDVARILRGADPEADAVELAVKPRLRQNKSERRGVQKPRDVHHAHVTRIDRHRLPPSPARRHIQSG